MNNSKCHNIHIWKQCEKEMKLKAHDDIIINVDDDKYIGDIVSKDGKNMENIKSRVGKGISAI